MNPSSCDDIRAAGFRVFAHEDMSDGTGTNWVFRRGRPMRYVQAVGKTDEEALTKIRLELGLPTNDEKEYQAVAMREKETR